MNKKILIGFCLAWTVIISFILSTQLRYNDRVNSLQSDIESLEVALADSTLENLKFEDESMQTFSQMNVNLDRKTEQISIIEASIDPADKRWAKVKQVRQVVRDTIEHNGYKKLSTKDLTAYASAVVQWSEEYDVPVSLIVGLTRRESAFAPGATSYDKNGNPLARGMMQIIPSTGKEIAAELGIRHYNLYKIKDNVRFGIYYLMKMLDEFHDPALAVRAYNCGPTCVNKVSSGAWSDYPAETRKYVEIICGDEDKGIYGYVKYYEDLGL